MPAVAKKPKRQPAKPKPVDDEPHRFRVPDGAVPFVADPPKRYIPKTVIDLQAEPDAVPVKTPEPAGLECVNCSGTMFDVERTIRKPGKIIRIRRCTHCGKTKHTTEVDTFDVAKLLPVANSPEWKRIY